LFFVQLRVLGGYFWGFWAFLGVSGGKGLGKGLFGVILCVAFPNLLLRRLGFRDLGSGGYFWGFWAFLGVSGGKGAGKGTFWGDFVCSLS
jgi:hypothetical protein